MLLKFKSVYKRILLKLSGELLCDNKNSAILPQNIKRIVSEIQFLLNLGIQIGLVIGGGNLFRGSELNNLGFRRVISDQIGMLSTVINALALHEKMQCMNIKSCLFSAKILEGICESYQLDKVLEAFESKKVVIFCLGLGHPFFTTDSAACVRSIEIGADILLKATHVDGVYSSDPIKNKSAVMYKKITYQEVLNKNLRIMDQTAILLARDYNLPIYIFNMLHSGSLLNIVLGKSFKGTLITN